MHFLNALYTIYLNNFVDGVCIKPSQYLAPLLLSPSQPLADIFFSIIGARTFKKPLYALLVWNVDVKHCNLHTLVKRHCSVNHWHLLFTARKAIDDKVTVTR